MASKKLKRAGKAAAVIGAAYLASQALKKPKTKPFSVVRRKGDTFGASTAQEIEASRPRDTFESDMAVDPTDTGYDPMSSNEGFGPMAKEGKFISKKMRSGGSVVARGNKLARSKPTKLF